MDDPEKPDKVTGGMTTAVRNLLLGLAVVLVFSVSYYFVVALPAHNQRLLEFAREKYQAELVAQEAARINDEVKEKVREQMREQCSNVAESDYWAYIKLNGKPTPDKEADTFTAPGHVWDQAQKRKVDALTECLRKYGARQ